MGHPVWQGTGLRPPSSPARSQPAAGVQRPSPEPRSAADRVPPPIPLQAYAGSPAPAIFQFMLARCRRQITGALSSPHAAHRLCNPSKAAAWLCQAWPGQRGTGPSRTPVPLSSPCSRLVRARRHPSAAVPRKGPSKAAAPAGISAAPGTFSQASPTPDLLQQTWPQPKAPLLWSQTCSHA